MPCRLSPFGQASYFFATENDLSPSDFPPVVATATLYAPVGHAVGFVMRNATWPAVAAVSTFTVRPDSWVHVATSLSPDGTLVAATVA